MAADAASSNPSELALFRETVRRFVDAELVPNEARWREQQYVDRAAWRKAGDLGLLLCAVPDAMGGVGADLRYEAVVFEELARGGAMGFGKHVHEIVAHYLVGYGTDEQRRRWLPKMASGESIAAIAMSEPGAGSDLQGVRTRAVRDGDHYVVNGSKTFISNGYLADLVLLVCKTDPQAGARGTSLLMIETQDLPGFRRGRILAKIGQKAQDTAELFFDDVRVPASHLLGVEEGQGFAQLMQQLPFERTIIAVSAVAVMERAVELTAAYAKERRAFGKALIEMQNTRFKLAECQTVARVARVFVDDLSLIHI